MFSMLFLILIITWLHRQTNPPWVFLHLPLVHTFGNAIHSFISPMSGIKPFPLKWNASLRIDEVEILSKLIIRYLKSNITLIFNITCGQSVSNSIVPGRGHLLHDCPQPSPIVQQQWSFLYNPPIYNNFKYLLKKFWKVSLH